MSTLVFVCVGQSNMVGDGPSVTNTYSTLDRVHMVGLDGYIRNLSEPVWDNTRYATGGINHSSPDTAPMQSSIGAFADRLRTLGETRRMIFVPTALGSSSATQWSTGLADNPPTYLNVYGATRHAMAEAMRATGAIIGGVLVNQGEADAQVDAGTANAWDTKWGSTFDAINTWATSQSWTWAKAIHFWVDALQVGSGLAFASNVRARQFAIASARSDTHTIQEPDAVPAGSLHLAAAEQISLGTLRANDWYAAT